MFLQGYLVQVISDVLAGVNWYRLYLVYLQGYLTPAISGVLVGEPGTGYIWCT